MSVLAGSSEPADRSAHGRSLCPSITGLADSNSPACTDHSATAGAELPALSCIATALSSTPIAVAGLTWAGPGCQDMGVHWQRLTPWIIGVVLACAAAGAWFG